MNVDPESPTTSQQVDNCIAQLMHKYQIPGLALAVTRKGRVLKQQGYGLASVEFDLPVDEHTIFQLYSVTKIWTGIAAMRLVEDGKLSLDAPVTDLIDGLPPTWQAIHVRHLLTHTSGIREWSENAHAASLSDDEKKNLPVHKAVALSSELPLKFQPGDRFSYHRAGYNLFAMIVEKVTGESYGAFLQERVFAPSGMTSAVFGDTETVIKRRPSTAYNRETGELRNWVYLFGSPPYPSAGLNASIADLSSFFIALDEGRVLKPESLEAMWAPVRLNDGQEKGYGLGWTVETYRGRKMVGHEGGGSAWVAHMPGERLSIAVLCNLNGARADEIQYRVADLYLEGWW